MRSFCSHQSLERSALAGALSLLLLAIPATSGQAAGVRGEFGSYLAWVQARGLQKVTVSEDELEGEGIRRRLPNGTVVTCVPGMDCYYYTQGEIEDTVPLRQDLRLTGWSDVQGLSGRLHLRSRFGSDDFWPRSEEEFEIASGYVELDRRAFRLRAGRTSKHAGLGYYEFDGGTALIRATSGLSLELYGGRSLARGTSQPLTGFLLEEGDEAAPFEPGVIVGGEGVFRFWRRSRLAILYQRDLRADRVALYEERGAFDAHIQADPIVIDTSVDYDFASEHLNDARLRIDSALPKGYQLQASARYRRPHFSLWTIWEAFTPVGYREGRVSLGWTEPLARWGAQIGASYRKYEETYVELRGFPVTDDGWQIDAGGRYRRGAWRAEGTWRVDFGYGAAETHVDLDLGRTFGNALLGVQAYGTQQTREFRIGEDWIFGGGVQGQIDLATVTVRGSAGLYRLSYDNRADYSDWTQKRAQLALSYRFGSDPGLGRTNSVSRSEKGGE